MPRRCSVQKKKIQSLEVSDEFWKIVEPLLPKLQRDRNKKYRRKSGAAGSPWTRVKCSRRLFMCFVLESNGKPCQKNDLGVPVRRMPIFVSESRQAFSLICGAEGLLNTMKWRGWPGSGKALTTPWLKPLWPRKMSAWIRRTGIKNGS